MLTDGAFSFVPALVHWCGRRGGRTQVLALFRYRLLRNAARLFLHAILPCRTNTRPATLRAHVASSGRSSDAISSASASGASIATRRMTTRSGLVALTRFRISAHTLSSRERRTSLTGRLLHVGGARPLCSECVQLTPIVPYNAALERLQRTDSAWYNVVWIASGAIGREFESLRAHQFPPFSSRTSAPSERDGILGISPPCPELCPLRLAMAARTAFSDG